MYLSLYVNHNLIFKKAKDTSVSHLTILPKATSALKESLPCSCQAGVLLFCRWPWAHRVLPWTSIVAMSLLMRLAISSKCLIHVRTQKTFIERLLCTSHCGWPQGPSGEWNRQMPLSSGGNSKREFSDELDDFPDFMGR